MTVELQLFYVPASGSCHFWDWCIHPSNLSLFSARSLGTKWGLMPMDHSHSSIGIYFFSIFYIQFSINQKQDIHENTKSNTQLQSPTHPQTERERKKRKKEKNKQKQNKGIPITLKTDLQPLHHRSWQCFHICQIRLPHLFKYIIVISESM